MSQQMHLPRHHKTASTNGDTGQHCVRLTQACRQRAAQRQARCAGTVFKKRRFRRLRTPKPKKPIFVQPMMHLSFPIELRRFLQQRLTKHKQHKFKAGIQETPITSEDSAQLESSTQRLDTGHITYLHMPNSHATGRSAAYTSLTRGHITGRTIP